MRWRWIRPSLLLLFVVVPAICSAQGFPSLESIGWPVMGNVQIAPSARIGYQRMAVNFSLPIPFADQFGPALFPASELDFKLEDSGVWIGGVRIDAKGGALSLFATAEANASKSVRALTSSEPFWAGISPVDWSGSKLEWWSIGGGGAVDLSPGVAVVGGLRAEHLSLKLADPVDPDGTLRFFQAEFGDRYSSDLLTKLWVPYFGLQLDGANFTSTLVFSPYTWANVKIPFRYLFVVFPGIAYGFEEAEYTFKRSGFLLESTFDYRAQTTTNAGLSLWFKGTWCQIRGNGKEDYQFDFTVFDALLLRGTNSASASGSFTYYVLAGGINLDYTF